MTTHETVLLCSSLQVVGRCISLCWFWVLPPFQRLANLVTPHLQLEACRSMPHHSKFFLGSVGASSNCAWPVPRMAS